MPQSAGRDPDGTSRLKAQAILAKAGQDIIPGRAKAPPPKKFGERERARAHRQASRVLAKVRARTEAERAARAERKQRQALLARRTDVRRSAGTSATGNLISATNQHPAQCIDAPDDGAGITASELMEFNEHRALGVALAAWLDSQDVDVKAGTSAMLMTLSAALVQEAQSREELDRLLHAAVRFLATSARQQFSSNSRDRS